MRRCTVSDGNEVCCLEEGAHDVHMGRWYTMTEQAIAAWEAEQAQQVKPAYECENGGIVGCFCSVCNPVGWKP